MSDCKHDRVGRIGFADGDKLCGLCLLRERDEALLRVEHLSDGWRKLRAMADMELAKARAEVERLRGELSDVRSAHRAVLDEPCAKDEQHCTCVPFLRAEVERLKARIAEYQSACEQQDEIVRGSVVENQALVDCRAEVERLKARECPGLEEHDAYQHMATRALRAEAEVERLKKGWADERERIIEAMRAEQAVQRNRVLDQAARYREALELVWPLLDARLDPTCRAWNAVNQALHHAGREQNNDGAKASDPRSVAGSDSVSLRGGDTSPSGDGAIPAAPPSVTPSKSTHNLCWYPSCERSAMPDRDGCAEHAHTEPLGPCPHGCDPWDRCDGCGTFTSLRDALAAYRKRREAEPDDPTDAETHHLAADSAVAVALREVRAAFVEGDVNRTVAHLICCVEALAGRGK